MQKILSLAQNYAQISARNRAAHYRAAKLANQKHMLLGVPAIVTSTAVGTAIFASLNDNPSNTIKVLAGTVSLLGATLSALQTFFKFSELAERHRVAGAEYGDVKRRLDLFLVKYGSKDLSFEAEAIEKLAEIVDLLSKLAKESPDVPDAAYRLAGRHDEILGIKQTQNTSKQSNERSKQA